MRQAQGVLLLLLAAFVCLSAGFEYILPSGPLPNYGKAYQCTGTTKYIFPTTTPAYGTELYHHDAVATGTGETAVALLKDMSPGTASTVFFSFAPLSNGKIVFLAGTPEQGTALWVTDCTPAGTKVLYETYLGSPNDPTTGPIARPDGSEALFGYRESDNRFTLKGTTGTLASIRTVATLAATADFFNYSPTPLFCMGSLFLSWVNTTGIELYQLNLTTDTFSQVAEINPTSSSSPRNLMCHNNQYLIFTASNGSFVQFAYDGQNLTRITVNAQTASNIQYINFKSKAYIVDTTYKFRYFDTPETGFVLVPSQPTLPYITNLVVIGEAIHFHERETVSGGYAFNVYKFDGTNFTQFTNPAGRTSVGNNYITPSPFVLTPTYHPTSGIIAVFVGGHADTPSEQSHQPLYWIGVKDDDTLVDLSLIAEYPACMSVYTAPYAMVLDYQTALVMASFTPEAGQVLLKLFGASATPSTYLDLTAGPDYLFRASLIKPSALIDGKFLFPLWSSQHGWELWHTDGSSAALATNLSPSCSGNIIDVSTSSTISNGELFFAATTPADGGQIFGTKGTPETTHLALRPYFGADWSWESTVFCKGFAIFTGWSTGSAYYTFGATNFATTINMTFDGYISDWFCYPDGLSALILTYNYTDNASHLWKATATSLTELSNTTFYENSRATYVSGGVVVSVYGTNGVRVEFRTETSTTVLLDGYSDYPSIRELDSDSVVFRFENETDPLRLWRFNSQTLSLVSIENLNPIWGYYVTAGTFGHDSKFYYLAYDDNGYVGWAVTDFTPAGTKKLYSWQEADAIEPNFSPNDYTYFISQNSVLVFPIVSNIQRKLAFSSLTDGGFAALDGAENTYFYGDPFAFAALPNYKIVAAAQSPDRLILFDQPCFADSDCGVACAVCSAAHTCSTQACPNPPTGTPSPAGTPVTPSANGASYLGSTALLAVLLGAVALLW